MNPLDQYPEIRKYLYLFQWVVNLIMGAIAVVLLALDQNPLWFIIVTAVLNFLWTYTGLTAKSNINSPPEPNPKHKDEDPGLKYENDPEGNNLF